MADDKTEEPTQTRLDQAREQGDVPQSREFASFILFVGLALAFYFYGPTMIKRLVQVFQTYFDYRMFDVSTAPEFLQVLTKITWEILGIIGPLFGVVALFGVAGYMGQFGVLFTAEKLVPDFNKLNPLNGAQRFFSKEMLVEFVKALLKVIILTAIVYVLFKDEFRNINQYGAQPLYKSFYYFIDVLGRLFFAMLLFMAVLGISDFAFQRWNYNQRHRMSVEEVKEEMKQKEGDPQIKSRIRQIQRDRARKRMMEDVPKADVIVTNPTHVAVALKYERGKMKAPTVVAKGAGIIALKIKEIAAKAGVPILEKKQLARYLYRNVEVGELIPESLYTAVAEVLAYVFRIKRRVARVING